jgi:RNA polymerase sigma-70 factor, ECF subfamily
MLMRARSIRLSIHPESELPFNWEAPLRTVFGPLFGPLFGPFLGPVTSLLPSGLTQADAMAQAAQSGSGEEGPEDGSKDGNPGEETAYGTELSGPDGVPEDMATMVLNGPALGAGSASGSALRPGATPEERAALREELDPKSDAAIMLRVAEGDEAGFNYLATKYHRPMIHFLYRMVGNQAVAEELAQEVFLRVYRARSSYRAEARFTTWLYRIATNLAVNHARDTRHERNAQTIYLDQPDPETGTTPDVADDEPTAEQQLMRDERMAAIRLHVMALPERQRMAVLMHKYQGMDYRQIGEVLKLSESATKSLLFRAYQTLRDKLKDFV